MYCAEALGIVFIGINCEYELPFMPACFGREGKLTPDLTWDQISEFRWLIAEKTGMKVNKCFLLVLPMFNRSVFHGFSLLFHFVSFPVITPKNMLSPQLVLLWVPFHPDSQQGDHVWVCSWFLFQTIHWKRRRDEAEVEMPKGQASDGVIVS